MMIKAAGAGSYGSVNGASKPGPSSRPAVGNSKMLPAKSPSSLGAVARQQTEAFISNAKRVAQGASGVSRISIRA